MALAQEDLEQIQDLIKKSIQATPEVGNANVRLRLECGKEQSVLKPSLNISES